MSLVRAVGLCALFVGLAACSSKKAPEETGSARSGITCGEEVCYEHSSCDGTQCVCDAGFEKVGTACIDINECLIDHGGCDPFASCINTPGSFECRCRTGFEGDGSYCFEAGTDGGSGPCGRCDPNATCETHEITGESECYCKDGFEGNGRRCTDINECLESDCDPNATCKNLPGTRSCECKEGFFGDGLKCSAGEDHGVGSDCLATGGQSNCDAGLTCRAALGLNFCTKTPCSANSECGKNGSLQNVCLDLGDSAKQCLRTCDPYNPASCGRDGVVCSPTRVLGRNYNLCVPDCRLGTAASACVYGATCSATSGVCEKKSCASQPCGAGEACVTEDTEKICVPDCRIADLCPAERQCNLATGGCDVPKKTHYETCRTHGDCSSGLSCVTFSTTSVEGICMQNCKFNSECTLTPPGKPSLTSVCNLPVSSQDKMCVIDCRNRASVCPTGTTCTQYSSNFFCLP